jgi:GNAT superfamily N-acetyltransferase
MTTITPAQTRVNYKRIANLAKIIWNEHYTPIIGEQQVSYMLKKFQSATAIENEVDKGIEYYLLTHQGVCVGYFSFIKGEEFLFISKLYVLKTARGNGIGKAALSFMETRAKELGLKKIRLTVNKFNSNSIKAYEKMAFVNIDAIVQNIGSGYIMDDYVLEKIIK